LHAIANRTSASRSLPKAPTGIAGLDEITGGGLPRGRPTLVCGNAGCGKTLFAVEFLVRAATKFNEPGVLMCFEETAEELTQNVRSLGWDLDALVKKKKLVVDFVYIEPSEIVETGDFDLEGLFVRLGYAIDSIGAKRVVLDSLEVLFGGLSNAAVLRAELRRLFRWLKDKGVTVVITGESGLGQWTRYGIEEYVSDCVILLDHRVIEQVSTRRLRVAKYRGTTHGTNEYPFLIDQDGISVLPITSLGLEHKVSDERVSTGVAGLDAMLGGKGYFRGSTVLVSGASGSGKSSLAAHLVLAACQRAERCLYFAFEESPEQILRNMRSIGIDLAPWVKKGLLRFHSTRSTLYGLEMHLATMHKLVREFTPQVVVADPVGTLVQAGSRIEATAMLTRLIDFLKSNGSTTFLTSLSHGEQGQEGADINVSSLVDTWLSLRDIELDGERNRCIYVIKSRGMAHSNQVREFLLTPRGIELADVYLGPQGVLTGLARRSQETRVRAITLQAQQKVESERRELARNREALEVRIAGIRDEFEARAQESASAIGVDRARQGMALHELEQLAAGRQADAEPAAAEKPARPRVAERRK
jgi:circadian clock protein KaiC